MKKQNKPGKYVRHVGTKQLAKKLTAKLMKDCKGKSLEECVLLEAALLEKISVKQNPEISPDSEKSLT